MIAAYYLHAETRPKTRRQSEIDACAGLANLSANYWASYWANYWASYWANYWAS